MGTECGNKTLTVLSLVLGSQYPDHWATTIEQPLALTILCMYCTGGTECTPGSYSVMSVIRTLLRVDHKIPLHQERNHAVMVSLASNILPQFKKICYESKMEETPKRYVVLQPREYSFSNSVLSWPIFAPWNSYMHYTMQSSVWLCLFLFSLPLKASLIKGKISWGVCDPVVGSCDGRNYWRPNPCLHVH